MRCKENSSTTAEVKSAHRHFGMFVHSSVVDVIHQTMGIFHIVPLALYFHGVSFQSAPIYEERSILITPKTTFVLNYFVV